MENKFMRVEEVAEVLEVSTSFAYKVIRQLNDELKANAVTMAARCAYTLSKRDDACRS